MLSYANCPGASAGSLNLFLHIKPVCLSMLGDQTWSGEETSSPLLASLLAAGAVVASALGAVGDRRQQAWGLPVDRKDSPAVSELGFHKSLKIGALKC